MALQTNNKDTRMLAAALKYAARGLSVMPLIPGGKKPATRHGSTEASADPEVINKWWAKWPNANIGVATGLISGVIGVDVDDKDGRPGKKSLEKLLAAGELLTATVKTPSGGLHLYFKIKPGVKITNRADVMPGIDIRGDGGYLVVPPSSIDGKQYEWVKDRTEIIDLPPWLMEIITAKKESLKADEQVTKGSRNQTLTSLAGSMRRRGMTRDAILAALRQENISRCSPPLPDAEVLQIADSVMRYDPAKKVDYLRFTDSGNVDQFIREHGADVRFVSEYKQFLTWKEDHWEIDHGVDVMARALSTVRNIHDEAEKEQDDKLRKQMLSWSVASANAGKLESMIKLARSRREILVMQDSLDNDPWLMGVQNGVLDLRSGSLCEARREDMITAQAGAAYVPGAKCPTFESFMDRIFDGNIELIEFVQRAFGYSLTGKTGEQCLFFAYGGGANGKSTLFHIIGKVLGDYGKAIAADMLVDRQVGAQTNDLARLRGARFVSTVEVEEGKRMAEAVVKQVTGGERITARFLYGEFFEYPPTFKLWLAANHKPIIRGTDSAIWRRIRLVPFSITIPEKDRDPELPLKLESELPGIFNWAVDGCLDWQKQRLNPPKEVLAVTASYRNEMDVLGAWLEECCVRDEHKSASASALYENHRRWAEVNGEWAMPQSRFKVKMEERGFTRKRSATGILYVGVGIVAREYSGSEV